MKNNSPNIQQIFMRKKAYQSHIKKLSDIRQIKRNQVTHCQQVNSHIKLQKHVHFLDKMSQNSQKIQKQNLSIYTKLHRILTCPKKQSPISQIKASSYRKLQANRKRFLENKRISQKINSSRSSLNNEKMKQAEKKRNQIKNRLRKYTDTAQLKCERYFKLDQSFTSSFSKKKEKVRSSTFYDKSQILRNRVEQKTEGRPATTSNRKRKKICLRINTFFPTSQEI